MKTMNQTAFKIGDCVYIKYEPHRNCMRAGGWEGQSRCYGMHKKFIINRKRLSLYIDSKELTRKIMIFVIMESKENRKKRKAMGKRHVEGMAIEVKK